MEQFRKEMIGACPQLLQVFQLIRKVAPADIPVLVTGASGTGKEMVARAIHQRSLRACGPFIAINCGAIPKELLESELFGYEKGAFTGAHCNRVGKVELAQGGTLFLDEIAELPVELQVKLLRFLEDHSFERIGGRQVLRVDFRLISATSCDLTELTNAGRFRHDLYYRLRVVEISLPDLKDRGDDLLLMAHVFLRHYASQMGRKTSGFTPDALQAMEDYTWPGNVRELINSIRRAVVLAEGSLITPENLGLCGAPQLPKETGEWGLKEARGQLEISLITRALLNSGGSVQLAAKSLKTTRSAVYHLLKKYGISISKILDHVSTRQGYQDTDPLIQTRTTSAAKPSLSATQPANESEGRAQYHRA